MRSKKKVEVVGDKIEFGGKPEVKIVRKEDGLPVVLGWESFDAAQAVRDVRDEQVERLDGLFRKGSR